MINYPILLIDLAHTRKTGLVISIGKPVISFSEDRYNSNLEMVHKSFCDSTGNVFKLIGIDKIKTDFNPIKLITNKLHFQQFGQYRFRETGQHIEREELRTIAIELMRIETTEEAWEQEILRINNTKDYAGIIDSFYFGRQE